LKEDSEGDNVIILRKFCVWKVVERGVGSCSQLNCGSSSVELSTRSYYTITERMGLFLCFKVQIAWSPTAYLFCSAATLSPETKQPECETAYSPISTAERI
jgi:hypothetical protein